MRARTVGALALVGVATTAIVRSRSRGQRAGTSGRARSGWLAVTVYRPAADVLAGGDRPAPLAAFGDAIDVEVRPAPGDKGTELRARQRPGTPDATGRLRAALREAKQLIEVGEVLRVDPTPHGRRSATPTGLLVDVLSARSNEGGTL